MATNSKTLLKRLVGFLAYILIGAAILMQIEKDKDKGTSMHTFEELKSQWIKKYNLTREIITELLEDYDRVRENRAKPSWSFLNSVYFVLQLVTTIGKVVTSILCMRVIFYTRFLRSSI